MYHSKYWCLMKMVDYIRPTYLRVLLAGCMVKRNRYCQEKRQIKLHTITQEGTCTVNQHQLCSRLRMLCLLCLHLDTDILSCMFPLKGWTHLTLAHMEKSIISGYELFLTNIYSIIIRFTNIFLNQYLVVWFQGCRRRCMEVCLQGAGWRILLWSYQSKGE